MGKHSDFRISSFQVVDGCRILQFNRKTEKYFKEFIWFWVSTYRLIFGPVLKLKKLSCAAEAFRIILLQRHTKFSVAKMMDNQLVLLYFISF